MTEPSSTACQAVQEMLSWYANETLQGHELEHVIHHLTTCTGCQQELALWRGIATLLQVAAEAPPALASPGQSYAQLMAHIDASEAESPWWKKLRRQLSLYTHTLWNSPGAVRWTLALGSLLLVVMSATLLRTLPLLGGTPYRTLSQLETPPRSSGMRVRLVFAEETMERDIRALLTQVQGSFVQGPSRLGVYTIVLEASPPAAMSMEQRLARLRAYPQVRLAEPVTTP